MKTFKILSILFVSLITITLTSCTKEVAEPAIDLVIEKESNERRASLSPTIGGGGGGSAVCDCTTTLLTPTVDYVWNELTVNKVTDCTINHIIIRDTHAGGAILAYTTVIGGNVNNWQFDTSSFDACQNLFIQVLGANSPSCDYLEMYNEDDIFHTYLEPGADPC